MQVQIGMTTVEISIEASPKDKITAHDPAVALLDGIHILKRHDKENYTIFIVAPFILAQKLNQLDCGVLNQ